jgi:hypothetical protein
MMESKKSNALTGKWVHQPWDPGGREDQVYILPIQRIERGTENI